MNMIDYCDAVLVCGHRGDRVHGDENTMRAIRRAVAAGVDMIETDVRMTRDGQLVLMHDARVDDTTDGTGLVRDYTLSELRRFNAAAHSDGDFEPIPTLDEFLRFAGEHPKLLLTVEFKDIPEKGYELFAYECADKICEAILAHGVGDRTIICSFSGRIVEYVYRRYGSAFHYHGFYPWFIMGEMDIPPEDFVEVVCMQHHYQDANGATVKCDDPLCPEDWFAPLLKKGIMPLMAPSLRDTEKYWRALSWGSRIVNHDDPYAFLAFLRGQGLHR